MSREVKLENEDVTYQLTEDIRSVTQSVTLILLIIKIRQLSISIIPDYSLCPSPNILVSPTVPTKSVLYCKFNSELL